jgi:hypothetical protein
MIWAVSPWDRKLTPMAHMNAGHPWALWTLANEHAITAAVEWELWRSSFNNTGELGLCQPRVLKALHDNQLHPHHYSQEGTHVCIWSSPMDAILWMAVTSTHCGAFLCNILWIDACFPRKGHSTPTTDTSGHGIVLMLSMNVGIKSASVSVFGLESSRTLS